jgi:hypothetical protein
MPTTPQEWSIAQRQDLPSRKIHRLVREGDEATLRKGFFTTEEGVLMRTTRAGHNAVWVPPRLRPAILKSHHDHPLSGHLGILKTTSRVSQNYTWKGIKSDVRLYIKGCDTCQRVKPNNVGPKGMMDSRLAMGPGESASCDLIGPLPKSPSGHEHALVIVDDFTKNFEIYPLRKATAKSVADKLIEYCCRYGFMKNLRSDRGPQFASHVWHTVCEKMGIKPRKIVAYRPQGNPTERANRTIKECIKAYAEVHRDWDKNLSAIAFALRTTINETTKHSPAMLTFGHELRSPFVTPTPDPVEGYKTNEGRASEYATKLRQNLANTFTEVRENCRRAQERQARYYNQGRKPSDLVVGDWVMRRAHTLSDAGRGVASSLSPLYEGPFRLSRENSNNVFELEDEEGEYVCTRNVDQLRKYHQPPMWTEPDDREKIVDSDSSTSSKEDDPGGKPEPPPGLPAVIPQIEVDEPPQNHRPRRERNIPQRLRDYVLSSRQT